VKNIVGNFPVFLTTTGQYLLGMCYIHDKDILSPFHGSEVTLSLTHKRRETWELGPYARISLTVLKVLVLFGIEWTAVGHRNCLLITNRLAGVLLPCDGVIAVDSITGSSTQRM
jgi:hypothetical protein